MPYQYYLPYVWYHTDCHIARLKYCNDFVPVVRPFTIDLLRSVGFRTWLRRFSQLGVATEDVFSRIDLTITFKRLVQRKSSCFSVFATTPLTHHDDNEKYTHRKGSVPENDVTRLPTPDHTCVWCLNCSTD